MASVILQVPDISCGHCARTITEALENKPGVGKVSVDIPAKSVYLAYDDRVITLEEVSETLDEEGYTVAQISRN